MPPGVRPHDRRPPVVGRTLDVAAIGRRLFGDIGSGIQKGTWGAAHGAKRAFHHYYDKKYYQTPLDEFNKKFGTDWMTPKRIYPRGSPSIRARNHYQ